MKDKDNTKRKLIDAVGEIFRTEGPGGLGVNKAARIAGVNKKLIYRYFTSFEELVEMYIVETDYWMAFADKVQGLIDGKKPADSQKLVTDILQNQFRYFYADTQMQKLITWEISANSSLMKSIHHARESTGQKVLEFTDGYFKDSSVNFRAVTALLAGGIYYMVLHTRFNGSVFADMDISTEKDREEIVKTIGDIITWAYKA